MANKKLTELDELPSVDVDGDDVILIADLSAGPTGTKKIKVSSLTPFFLPSGVFYFGVDESVAIWRWIIVGSNLQLQFKDGLGVWTKKDELTPELS